MGQNNKIDVKTKDNLISEVEKSSASTDKSGKLDNIEGNVEAHKAKEIGEDRTFEIGATNKMLKELTDDIAKELKCKYWAKLGLIIFTIIYFIVITNLVFKITFNKHYSDYLKSVLLGGFFANLIGLIVIIFKYVFSQSKDLYDFWIDIRNGIYHKIDE